MAEFAFRSAGRRIDWLYSQFGGPNVRNVADFVDAINRVYYRHAAARYGERYTEDIASEFAQMCESDVFPRYDGRVVVNIGGGAGFEYKQLCSNQVNWSEYVFIEPDPRMAEEFCSSSGVRDSRVSVLHGTLGDHAEYIRTIRNKLIVICSCLHHIIWVEDFLDLVKSVMHVGDYLVLAHEPNNMYYGTPLMAGSAFLRAITSDVLLRRFGIGLFAGGRAEARFWVKINQDLLSAGIASREMPPIAIRRTIDYWVGTKGDWKKLGIPKEYNEGFWSAKDLEEYLGPSFRTRFYRTYRRFGDPCGRGWVRHADRLLSRCTPDGGSVFNLLIQRCQ